MTDDLMDVKLLIFEWINGNLSYRKFCLLRLDRIMNHSVQGSALSTNHWTNIRGQV